jgi:lysophospholipase L1-like esterase
MDASAISMTRPASSVRRTAGLVLYNIAATLALILALEGMASIYHDFRDAFASPPVAESLHTAYDRDLGWVNLPNVYRPNMYGPGKYLRTNSQRFRNNADFTASVPPGKTRIICSGDSFTLGYGVDNDHTWPQQLATRASNIETVNMGQGGYGADQAYLWYKRDGVVLDHDIQILALVSPDFYRMQHSSFEGYGKPLLAIANDHIATTNVPVPRSMEVRSPFLARTANALSNLSITRFLRRLLRLDTAPVVTQTQRERNEETALVLSQMLDDLLTTNRAKASVLVLAYLPMRQELWRGGDLEGSLRKILAEYARQRGVLYLDLADDFHRLPPEELDKLYIDRGAIDLLGAAGHYTEAGNAFVADLLYRRLLANPETAAKLHIQPISAGP